MSLNKVMLIGRLGQDPELKHTPSGAAVVNFSVATSESWNDKDGKKQEKTEWSRIVAWNKLAEICNQYLKKGSQCYVEGKLATRTWDDKDGKKQYTTEVIATTVQFLDSKMKAEAATPSDDQYKQKISNAFPTESQESFASDTIPF